MSPQEVIALLQLVARLQLQVGALERERDELREMLSAAFSETEQAPRDPG